MAVLVCRRRHLLDASRLISPARREAAHEVKIAARFCTYRGVNHGRALVRPGKRRYLQRVLVHCLHQQDGSGGRTMDGNKVRLHGDYFQHLGCRIDGRDLDWQRFCAAPVLGDGVLDKSEILLARGDIQVHDGDLGRRGFQRLGEIADTHLRHSLVVAKTGIEHRCRWLGACLGGRVGSHNRHLALPD